MKKPRTHLIHTAWAAFGAAAFFSGRLDHPQAARSPNPPILEQPGTRASRSHARVSPRPHSRRTEESAGGFDPIAQERRFLDLLEDPNPTHLEHALTRLSDSMAGSPEQLHRARLLFQVWGEIDPATAVERAIAYDDGENRSALEGALCGWARCDPDAVRDWVIGHDVEPQQIASMVGSLAGYDLKSATRLAAEWPEVKSRGLLVRAISMEIARRADEDSAAIWIAELETPDLRDRAASELVRGVTRRAGTEAAAAWVARDPMLAECEGAVGRVAEDWARSSPRAAAEWLLGMPEESSRTALARVVANWTLDDPVATGEFLLKLPNSPMRSQVVHEFAVCLAPESPDIAYQWAESIEDPMLRDQAMRGVVRIWKNLAEDGSNDGSGAHDG